MIIGGITYFNYSLGVEWLVLPNGLEFYQCTASLQPKFKSHGNSNGCNLLVEPLLWLGNMLVSLDEERYMLLKKDIHG